LSAPPPSSSRPTSANRQPPSLLTPASRPAPRKALSHPIANMVPHALTCPPPPMPFCPGRGEVAPGRRLTSVPLVREFSDPSSSTRLRAAPPSVGAAAQGFNRHPRPPPRGHHGRRAGETSRRCAHDVLARRRRRHRRCQGNRRQPAIAVSAAQRCPGNPRTIPSGANSVAATASKIREALRPVGNDRSATFHHTWPPGVNRFDRPAFLGYASNVDKDWR